MCSIFGFVAKGNAGPNLDQLRRIINRNAQTVSFNVNAHGLAWVDANQRMGCYKRIGDFRNHLDVLDNVHNARVLIGHLRKTTVGTHENNHNNHPHIFDGGWLIHNGTIHNYQDLISEWEVHPSTECDSEVLGLIASRINRPRINQLEVSINQVNQSCSFSCMVIDHRPARLWVARRGKPLVSFSSREGTYFCSYGGQEVCPRDREFGNNQVVEYVWKRNRGGKRHRSLQLRPFCKVDIFKSTIGRPVRDHQPEYRPQVRDRIRLCERCGAEITDYGDGSYCDCRLHEMDEDAWKWNEIELMDPFEMDRIAR